MGNNAIQNAFRGYNFGIPNPVEIKLDFSKRIYYATDMRRDTNLIAVKGGYSDLQTELKNTYDFYVSKQVGAKGSHIGATVPIAWGLLGQGEWKWQKFWFSTGKAGVPYLSLRYWTDTTYEVGMTMQRALTGGTAAADAADTLDAYIKDGRLIADTKTKGRLKVAGGTLIRTVRGAVSTLLSMLDFGASEYILTDQFVPNLGIEALMAMSWFDGTAGEGTSTSNAITVTSHNAVQEELVLSPRILFYLLADKIWKNYYKVWKEKKATRPLKNIMWDLAHVYGNVWSSACTLARYTNLLTKPADPRQPRCQLPLNNEFGEHFWDLNFMLHPSNPVRVYLSGLDKRDAYYQRTLEDAVWYRDIGEQWSCDPIALHHYRG